MKNIVVTAKIEAKSEFKDEVYAELVKLHTATHKNDEGCIQYDLHKDLDNKNSFTFIETWKNKDFLSTHEKKEHFVNFVKNIDGKIKDLAINKLEKLDI